MAHPAQLVVDLLGNISDENQPIRCSQLEAWFQEYANFRGNPAIFKAAGFVTRQYAFPTGSETYYFGSSMLTVQFSIQSTILK